MLGAVATSAALWLPPSFHSNCNFVPRICFPRKSSNPRPRFSHTHYFSSSSTSSPHFSFSKSSRRQTHFYAEAASSSSSSAASAEYVDEPATNVKFQTSLSLPGCSDSLTLFGTGYREKVFAIIGVKVYAAAPFEKSLQIILVRDVDGKTFWDALDDAISPRIKGPTTEDETALSTFRGVFQDRPLKKGTFIFLTWLNPSKLLVFVSSHGFPSTVDATIESTNVASGLFDVFLGDSPVSPTLKASVANGLSKVLK